MNAPLIYLKYLIIIFLCTFSVYASTEESFIRQGDLHHSNFNNIKALEYYQKAYEVNPDNFEIIKKLIITSNDCGEDQVEIDEEKAKEYFSLSVRYTEMAKEKYPDKPELFLLLGLSYGNSSRYAEGREKVKLARDVEENFKRMIELEPDYAPPYIGLGIYYREVANLNFFLKFIAKKFLGGLPNGTLEDSETMLVKAVELAPERVFTHYELAITYLEIGETEKVKYHLKKVLELPETDHLDPLKKRTAKKILMDLNT
ncbi:MAG: tetratricopeptide repeat protein [Thermodesulfobacteriota bacterium]